MPLRLEGTPFRKEAWALLRKVPYGETVSYGGLARRLELKRADGRRVSARAIGGAAHHNPIALIVPCHRVVGADGSLTGYAGGIETKIRLLQLEGVLKQTERMDVDCESRPDLAIHPLTASAALLALFCASVPMTASPGFTVVLVIAVIRSGVRPSPLPPCVQNG